MTHDRSNRHFVNGFTRAVTFAISLLAVVTSSPAHSPGTNQDKPPQRPELQVRVTTVAATMDEETVDPTRSQSKFATFEDVAFAVEIKNVSEKPVSILDTRYGNSFGDSSGNSNADWYSQFLFSIDYFDSDGNPFDQPTTIIVDADMVVSSALVVELQPDATHRILIRPAKWLNALRPRPGKGQHSAIVTYHGMSVPAAKRVREFRPESESLSAWSGTASASSVPFEIEQAADSPADLTWGEEYGGLRAAMDLFPAAAGHSFGTKPKVRLHIQNVGDAVIVLSGFLWQSEIKMNGTDAKDKEVSLKGVWYSGWTLTGRTSLQPGQITVIDAGNLAIARNSKQAESFEHVTNRTLIGSAGEYKLTLNGLFGGSGALKDGKGKVLAPLKGDYDGELTTGPFTLLVTEEVAVSTNAKMSNTPPLKRLVTREFKRASLQNALESICESAEVVPELDGDSLKLLGYTRNMVVQLNLSDVPLGEAVEKLIKPFDGLAWALIRSDDGKTHRLVVGSQAAVDAITDDEATDPAGCDDTSGG
jgi:hypothetical protein